MAAILTAIKRGFGVASKNLGLVLILIVFNVIGSLVSIPFAAVPGQTPTPQMTVSALIFNASTELSTESVVSVRGTAGVTNESALRPSCGLGIGSY